MATCWPGARHARGKRRHGRVDAARRRPACRRASPRRRGQPARQAADDVARTRPAVPASSSRGMPSASSISSDQRAARRCRRRRRCCRPTSRSTAISPVSGMDHERIGRQEVARLLPHLGPVVPQPQHLGVAVVAVDAVAGDAAPADRHRRRDGPTRPRRCARRSIQMRHGCSGSHALVDRDARSAVEAADADRRARRRHRSRVRRLRAATQPAMHSTTASSQTCRPLLGPERLRRIGLIARDVLRDDPAARVAQQRLRALRADVDADDVVHARRCLRHVSGARASAAP